MKIYNNIFLIGPMGSGKSTVGKELSLKLRRNFYDSDYEIQKYTGLDVKSIFKLEGELAFRRIEENLIEKLTQMEGIILSTGGGTITSKKNRHLLILRGNVIYLKVSISKQIYRTKNDQNRPLLQNMIDNSKIDILKFLHKERNNIYHKTADYMISTDISSIQNIVNEILYKEKSFNN